MKKEYMFSVYVTVEIDEEGDYLEPRYILRKMLTDLRREFKRDATFDAELMDTKEVPDGQS